MASVSLPVSLYLGGMAVPLWLAAGTNHKDVMLHAMPFLSETDYKKGHLRAGKMLVMRFQNDLGFQWGLNPHCMWPHNGYCYLAI